MVPSIPMAIMPMMAFVLLRKASVIGEIKNNRFLVSQFKLLQKKENREELVSLILQNSSKQIAHTPKKSYCLNLKKRILLNPKLFY
jgi:hypothetical protein